MFSVTFLPPGALLVLVLLVFGPLQSLARVVLTPESLTVAGINEAIGNADGGPGVSTIANPRGICPFDNTAAHEVLVIASVNRFRLLNQTNYLSVWFGKDPIPNTPENTDGVIAEAHLSNPKGCVRFIHPNSADKGTTYYVTGNEFVRWVDNNVVSSKSLGKDLKLIGIALLDYYLYVIDMLNPSVIRCTINTANPAPTNCKPFNLDNLPNSDLSGKDISVTRDGIFVAFGKGLNWYDDKAQFIGSTTQIPIRGVSHDPNSNTLWVATSSAVYNMSLPPLHRPYLQFDLFAGTENNSCKMFDNKDGSDPKFCGIDRLFVKNQNAIYLSLSNVNIIRAVVLPPKVVEISFHGKPFPIGMIGAEADLDKLYDLLDSTLNSNLKTNNIRVNRSMGTVLDNWTTKLNLLIEQREFDDKQTESEIKKMTFPDLMRELAAYYDKTNQLVYSDVILLPVCDAVKMNAIARAIAYHARSVLNYERIYADPFQAVSIAPTPTIISAKLLMPASFENQTTRDLLFNAQFHQLLLKVMKEIYPLDYQYAVRLPMQDYNFKNLSPYLEQQARLMILDLIETQLRQCESQTISVNVNPSPANGVPFLCEAKVGLSNRTLVPAIDYSSGINEFEVFIPTNRVYRFSISTCLDETSWDGLKMWINNSTAVITPNSRCGTGCIVGIAVALAVLVAILIIIVVVLVSKRRRLATVLVPKAPMAQNKKVLFKELY